MATATDDLYFPTEEEYLNRFGNEVLFDMVGENTELIDMFFAKVRFFKVNVDSRHIPKSISIFTSNPDQLCLDIGLDMASEDFKNLMESIDVESATDIMSIDYLRTSRLESSDTSTDDTTESTDTSTETSTESTTSDVDSGMTL